MSRCVWTNKSQTSLIGVEFWRPLIKADWQPYWPVLLGGIANALSLKDSAFFERWAYCLVYFGIKLTNILAIETLVFLLSIQKKLLYSGIAFILIMWLSSSLILTNPLPLHSFLSLEFVMISKFCHKSILTLSLRETPLDSEMDEHSKTNLSGTIEQWNTTTCEGYLACRRPRKAASSIWRIVRRRRCSTTLRGFGCNSEGG